MSEKSGHCYKFGSLFLLVGLLSLAVGIALSGEKILMGLKNFRNYDRYVTVKGLATKDVDADQAVWVLNFTSTGDDLAKAQEELEIQDKDVRAYLISQGFKEAEIQLQNMTVADSQAKTYGDEQKGPRFVLTQTLLARTSDIQAMVRASQNISDLIKKNVRLGTPNGGWNPQPQYEFTKINEIKPEMIAEATRNARVSAEQFASDSGQAVGTIRSANQGIVQIEARDPGVSEDNTPYKSVRVVTTIEYYLSE